MNDDEREILSEIQVNTAVTREKVENLADDVDDLRETTRTHDDRIGSVEQSQTKLNQNITYVGGAASFIAACLTAIFGKLVEWF